MQPCCDLPYAHEHCRHCAHVFASLTFSITPRVRVPPTCPSCGCPQKLPDNAEIGDTL